MCRCKGEVLCTVIVIGLNYEYLLFLNNMISMLSVLVVVDHDDSFVFFIENIFFTQSMGSIYLKCFGIMEEF